MRHVSPSPRRWCGSWPTSTANATGVEQRLIPGCFGIFGHGNVAGVGQALLEAHVTGSADLPYYLARNEQGMVHASVGYANTRNRLQALACTASIGPGSANMLTGAALATTNRIPVLLLASDIFATRVGSPVLQELELPSGYDISVNDAFRPLSRFFDRVWRPEQLPAALLGAMRVLADPAETGAVTLALPQDVQAEAHDWPEELFADRVWHVPRPVPEPAALARAVAVIRSARRPLLVAGGGVIYSEATAAAARGSPRPPASRSPTRRRARARSAGTTRRRSAASGPPGSPVANALARDADLVIGVGHPLQRLHHGVAHRVPEPRRAVRQPQRRRALDAAKHAGVMLVADAREGLAALADGLAGYRVDDAYTAVAPGAPRPLEPGRRRGLPPRPPAAARADRGAGRAERDRRAGRDDRAGGGLDAGRPADAVARRGPASSTTSSTPSPAWATRSPARSGIKMAAPEREVYSLVGDGSYLMMAQEIVTAVSEGIKLIVVIVQNHGFSSIGSLSESLGLAAVRHLVPLPQRRHRPARRRQAARSTWPPTPRASAPTSSG